MSEVNVPLPKGISLSRSGFYYTANPLPAGWHTNKVVPEVVEKVREWSRGRMRKTKTEPRNGVKTSYGLKHVAQKELGIYVSNGDLIAALILEGFQYVQVEINARFKHSVVK
jgi:hypothetical protein